MRVAFDGALAWGDEVDERGEPIEASDDQMQLALACRARAEAMFARRAEVRRKAKPSPDMPVWIAEQRLFHTWLGERFKLTPRDFMKVAALQVWLEEQHAERMRHQRPAAV